MPSSSSSLANIHNRQKPSRISTASSTQYTQLHTIRRVATFPSNGKYFCTGLTNHYEIGCCAQNASQRNKFPSTLSELFTATQEKRLRKYLTLMNQKISQYWPCACSYYCGHIFCLCTIGISLCLPWICVKQVQVVLKKQIKKINREVLKEKSLQMRLIKHYLTGSQLVIEEIDFQEFQI